MPPTLRWLGLVPLALFVGEAVSETLAGTPLALLWACHVANLCLGLGLLIGWPRLARAAALVLIPGLALWGVELLTVGATTPMSVLSHLGGVTVGLIALRRLGLDRHTWWVGFAGLVLLQELCRWVTPPGLNVNLSHAVHPSSTALFADYRVYRATLLALGLAGLAGLSAALRPRLVPPRGDPPAHRRWHNGAP